MIPIIVATQLFIYSPLARSLNRKHLDKFSAPQTSLQEPLLIILNVQNSMSLVIHEL